jgi:hypothetical protein
MPKLLTEDAHLNIEFEMVNDEGLKIVFVVQLTDAGAIHRIGTIVWDEGQAAVNKTMLRAVRDKAETYLEEHAELVSDRLREIRARRGRP